METNIFIIDTLNGDNIVKPFSYCEPIFVKLYPLRELMSIQMYTLWGQVIILGQNPYLNVDKNDENHMLLF